MKINFVDLAKQYKQISSDVKAQIEKVMETGSFVLGPAVAEFEKNFANYCKRKYCVGVASGADALKIALVAHNITSGEVITTPNTFFATALAITEAGATPVFVEIDEKTNNIDVTKIEQAITKNTKAIMPVHLFGNPCDMDPILAIAKKHNLVVIEDCAQSHGAEYKGKKVPIASTGCFSFYPGKNLGAYGDGGAIVTDDQKVAEEALRLRNFGYRTKNVHEELRGHSRLDSMQAAVLNAKLPHLDKWNESRRQHAAKLNSLLKGVVKVQESQSYAKSVYHLYVIETDKRDELAKFLNDKSIASGIHYPIPIHLQKAYSHLNYKEGSFPIAERKAKTILSLPMYPELTQEDINLIADSIKEFKSKNP